MSDTYQLENDISKVDSRVDAVERDLDYKIGDVRDDQRRTNRDVSALEDRVRDLEATVEILKNKLEYIEEKLNL